MELNFKIEQIAICPSDPQAAIKLLTAMGAAEWVKDLVVAKGVVYPEPQALSRKVDGPTEEVNVARLAFNYDMNPGKNLEFEVLNYAAGDNWMARQPNTASHLGMHCGASELAHWKAFFKRQRIPIAQEVHTQSHSNPAVAGIRFYHYCIFDTRPILGIDIKFIVRKDVDVGGAGGSPFE